MLKHSPEEIDALAKSLERKGSQVLDDNNYLRREIEMALSRLQQTTKDLQRKMDDLERDMYSLENAVKKLERKVEDVERQRY